MEKSSKKKKSIKKLKKTVTEPLESDFIPNEHRSSKLRTPMKKGDLNLKYGLT